jgi:hypothetical protein
MGYLGIKDDVFDLLTKYPELRDSDNKLIAAAWSRELRQKNINSTELTGRGLLKLIAEGELTAGESITRCRRKTQEEYKHLRGARYAERHGLEEDVKEELGYGNE